MKRDKREIKSGWRSAPPFGWRREPGCLQAVAGRVALSPGTLGSSSLCRSPGARCAELVNPNPPVPELRRRRRGCPQT